MEAKTQFGRSRLKMKIIPQNYENHSKPMTPFCLCSKRSQQIKSSKEIFCLAFLLYKSWNKILLQAQLKEVIQHLENLRLIKGQPTGQIGRLLKRLRRVAFVISTNFLLPEKLQTLLTSCSKP